MFLSLFTGRAFVLQEIYSCSVEWDTDWRVSVFCLNNVAGSGCVWNRADSTCPGAIAPKGRLPCSGRLGPYTRGSRVTSQRVGHSLFHQPDRWCAATSGGPPCLHIDTSSTHTADCGKSSRWDLFSYSRFLSWLSMSSQGIGLSSFLDSTRVFTVLLFTLQLGTSHIGLFSCMLDQILHTQITVNPSAQLRLCW